MSTQAVTSSAKLQQYLPSNTNINEDVLVHILSFLSEKERVILSRVCTTWKTLILKKIDLFAVKIADLLQCGEMYTHALCSSITITASSLICAHDNFLIMGYKDRIKIYIQTVLPRKTVLHFRECSPCILYENEKFLFLKDPESLRIIGIDKKAGTYLFITPEPEKVLRIEKVIVLFHVVSLDPLTFITVHYGGSVTKWRFEDQQITCVESWHVQQRVSFGLIHTDYLYIYELGGASNFYDLKNRKQTEVPFKELVSQLSHTATFEKSGSRVFQISDSSEGFRCIAFNLENADERWEQTFKTKTEFLIPPTDKWVFLKSESEKLLVRILSAVDGMELTTFSYDSDGEAQPAAKLYDSKLLIAYGKGVLIYNIEKNKILMATSLPERLLIFNPIKDFFYSGEKLYLLLNSGNLVTLEHDKKLNQIKKQATKTKILAIALGIFTLLAASGALALYFRGSINLSIGIGIATALMDSFALSLYAFSKRKLNRI